MHCQVFHHHDKIPDINNLKGGIVYFGSLYKRFQSFMMGTAWQSRAAHIMVAQKQRENS
jgi:hypothetical protein